MIYANTVMFVIVYFDMIRMQLVFSFTTYLICLILPMVSLLLVKLYICFVL